MKRLSIIMGVVAVCLTTSCQDSAWDDHYGQDSAAPSQNIVEMLAANSEYSEFLSVLKSEGLDSLLGTDQTFTVWAPNNTAMSAYSSDGNTINHFIKNHVCRYVYNASDLADTTNIRIMMLNGKFQDYSRATGIYTFADIPLQGNDILASNGVIHPLSAVAPFYLNLYEEIQNGDDTQSLATYLTNFDEYEFDKANSTPMGKNSLGQIVYDSVYNYNNDWMRRYGSIYLEDSIYTMIVPTETGWQAGYEKVYPYFRTFGTLETSSENATTHVPTRTYSVDDNLADSLSKAYTEENMAMNLVMRRKVDPYNADGDSLVATSGNSFHHLAELFAGAEEQTVSNGIMWKTDYWNFRPSETFLKTIEVEAENSTGRTNAYANIISRSSTETIYADSVSGQKYIEVTASTTNARTQPMVQFTIPNVLAATYNVYVVFAPAEAYSEGVEADSTRVRFFINYVHENGKMSEDAAITGGITSGNSMTKMFVTRISFPFSNFSQSVFDEGDEQDNDCVRLRVQTTVAASETSKMKRTMRIDKIVFEPVIDE